MTHLFATSESVTEGHPDKVCDQISDRILDEILSIDRDAKAAIEVMVSKGAVHVAGEVSTLQNVNVEHCVRDVLNRIGYNSASVGIDSHSCKIEVELEAQSSEIKSGVERAFEIRDSSNRSLSKNDTLGAGDQGVMFGFACNDTPAFMPISLEIAHSLTSRLSEVRHSDLVPYLLPDGKAQVTVKYENDAKVALGPIVLSAQHERGVSQCRIFSDMLNYVITPVLDTFGYG